PALAQTIGTLEDRFDVVLIDSPPLLSVADAAVLSKLASGVLLVVRAGRTRAEHVERAAEILRSVGAHLVGGVLNALPKKRLRGGGGGGGPPRDRRSMGRRACWRPPPPRRTPRSRPGPQTRRLAVGPGCYLPRHRHGAGPGSSSTGRRCGSRRRIRRPPNRAP